MKTFVALTFLLLQATQQPVFRASVNFVELDVSVLDEDRHPVLDLTAADFTVLEDGVRQKIESFELVVLPEPVPPPTPWWPSVPADVDRNSEVADGALILLIFDVLDGTLIHRVKEISRRIVDRMGPLDRMAVSHLGLSGNSQDFTTDRALLSASVDRFLPSPGLGDGACRPVYVLADIARLMAQQRGRRKTAFLVSDNIPEPVPGTTCFNALLELYREAQRANLNIYPINPHGLQGFADVTIESAEAMNLAMGRIRAQAGAERTLAEITGGFAISQTNLFDEHIDRAYVEHRAYYLIGYHSTNTSRDRRQRNLSVSVAREGVSVRSRSGYSVGTEKTPVPAARPSVPALLHDAARGAVPTTALALDATVVPFRGAKGPMLAVIAAARPALGAGSTMEQVQARAVLVDRFGDTRGTAERRVGASVTAAGDRAELRVPLLLSARPGRYQVRVAANSTASDQTGSVFVNVDVPDFARERLSLSGVALRVAPDSAIMALPQLAAVFPFTPSTRRTFRATDEVEAAVRVYTTRAEGPAAIVCRVRDAAEAEVSVVERVAPQLDTSDPAGALVRCPVAVATLGAGHYLLEIDARAGSRSAARKVKFIIE